MWVSLCAREITYWINLQILCFQNKDFNKFHSLTGECGNVYLIGRSFCMRSHYISRQAQLPNICDRWMIGPNILSFFADLVLFRDGSAVDVFGWNSSNVFANNALNSDFYAKYQWIEPEQATQIQESQLRFALARFLYALGNVRFLVHCKI